MTQNTPGDEPDLDDVSPPPFTNVRDVGGDAMLVSLAMMAMKSDEFLIGLTITVGGSTISGKLVSRRRWTDEMSETYGENVRDLVDPMVKAFENYEAEDPPTLPTLLHLVDARILNRPIVMPDPNQPGLFWRGRLDRVDGFAIGNLS